MTVLECNPIGIIHTPFQTRHDMPIQPAGAAETEGTVEILPEFIPGLKDLDGFSHIIHNSQSLYSFRAQNLSHI